MILTAAIALFWVIMAVGTGDRMYLLGTALLICAEMGYHYRCYVALIRRALTRKGSTNGRDQDLRQG